MKFIGAGLLVTAASAAVAFRTLVMTIAFAAFVSTTSMAAPASPSVPLVIAIPVVSSVIASSIIVSKATATAAVEPVVPFPRSWFITPSIPTILPIIISSTFLHFDWAVPFGFHLFDGLSQF